MLTLSDGIEIYLYSDPIDMRKGINGLTILLANELDANPQSGDLYVFRGPVLSRNDCTNSNH